MAVRLRAKELLSNNTLEAVRGFQRVKEAKNSRMLENVKHLITVVGLQRFKDFLSVLGEFHLFHTIFQSFTRYLSYVLSNNKIYRFFYLATHVHTTKFVQ